MIVCIMFSKVLEIIFEGKMIKMWIDMLFDVVLIGSGNCVKFFFLIVND